MFRFIEVTSSELGIIISFSTTEVPWLYVNVKSFADTK